MSRRFKVPRLFSVRMTLSSGKVIDRMLGVAFNVAERQKYYAQYRNFEYWRGVQFAG